MLSVKFLLYGCGLVALGSAVAAQDLEEAGNIKLITKLVAECGRKDDMGNCLKMRAFTFLDRLSRIQEPLQVTDYLQIVRDPNSSYVDRSTYGRSLSETELESVLPRSAEEKSSKLDEMLWDKLSSIFSGRSFQLTIPTSAFEGRKGDIGGGGGGGKGGKKGMGAAMMMAGMMMGMMMKMAMAKLMLIAGKALMMAKIALVLSLVMALKKWSGGGGGHHSEVIYAGDHSGHGRSFSEDTYDYAQNLAYNAQKPELE